MFCKDNFSETQKRFDAFWNKELVDRVPISVIAPKRGREVPPSNASYYNMYHAVKDGKYDAILDNFEARIENTYFGGEALPFFEIAIGPDQFAAFLGAELIAREDMPTTWVHKTLDTLEDYEPALDLSEDGYFKKVLAFYEKASKRCDGKYFLQMLDLHSNMDTLSALRSPQELCFDLYDCPEEVERVLAGVRKLYRPVYDAVFEAGNMEKYGSIGWAPTYCRGKFAVVQCDFSCMMSPDFARKYVIDAVSEEASYLDRCVYHYDGKEALGHLDDILAIPEIDCIQWVPGDGNPRSIEWMPLLEKIQKAGKSLWIYDWTPEEIMTRFKDLEVNKVFFSTYVGTQDEAERLIEYLEKHM